MKYVVESWAPEMGASVQSLDLEAAKEPTNLDVEFPLGQWPVMEPSGGASAAPEVAFVDGVRRIDARIWIEVPGDVPASGICATVAAGMVKASPGVAVCSNIEVKRYFLTSAPSQETIATPYGDYNYLLLKDDTPQVAMVSITRVMLALEVEISRTLDPERLVIYDGPLRGRDVLNGVGMIKTHHRMYLEGQAKEVVMGLQSGQSTPIFEILGREPRYAWYLQLPGKKSHPLSGVVRCEMSSNRSISEARVLADKVSLTLPKFASQAHKDTRAPQNLYPIAGLERELKRRLGDQRLLEHGLRRASVMEHS